MTDQIAVVGNITAAPERKVTGAGATMVKFGVASTERKFKDGAWGNGHTNFFEVIAFRGLAEHALNSLVKGQRVIVVGALRLTKWENNGKTGTSVDLEAASIGPDLLFGTAMFVGDRQSSTEHREAPGPAEEWAAPDDADAALSETASASSSIDASQAPALVTTGGRAAPGQDSTPF